MIQSLILTTKILITFSYLIIGLYIIDMIQKHALNIGILWIC
jgi:hypothetical protein